MRILITGSNGMLGRALADVLSDKYTVIGLDLVGKNGPKRLERFLGCDITDRQKTIDAIVSIQPEVIIHTAAYTDVDGCELNKERAERINAQGTKTIALACKRSQADLFYISTDFVFDGKKDSAYTETDIPNPINVYGQSKLAGEKYVQSIADKFLIIRSSWLFGQGGKNFVHTILQKTQDAQEVKMVNDQFGSPTYARDLAEAICKLIELNKSAQGILHITNSGSCSWYEFGQVIKEIAHLNIEIVAVSSENYDSPTRRPHMSILENKRYQKYAKEKLRHWRDALKEYLALFHGSSGQR